MVQGLDERRRDGGGVGARETSEVAARGKPEMATDTMKCAKRYDVEADYPVADATPDPVCLQRIARRTPVTP